MADVPDAIVLKRDRDLEGRQLDIWIRRGLMGLVAAVPVIALFNVFGQRPETHMLVGPAASLKIYAPERLRGGLLFEGRFHITARQTSRTRTSSSGPAGPRGCRSTRSSRAPSARRATAVGCRSSSATSARARAS